MSEAMPLREHIRRVIDNHSPLAVPIGTPGDQDDLFVAGMTSRASVNVMFALEERFEAGLAQLRSVPA